jgi:heme exporter protein B
MSNKLKIQRTFYSYLCRMNFSLIYQLIRKDVLIEWRQKYAFNGIILYVISTLFVIQLSFQRLRPDIWVTLFWIVILFSAVNAVAKSFMQESKGRLLYYYTISSPEDIILSKFIYNMLLLILLSLITFMGFILLFGNVIGNINFFLIILLLGSTGFAASFTMISGIAAKGSGGATLMTVLSFPVILPQLLLLIKLSKRAADGFDISIGSKELVSLFAINMIVVVVSYMLFPYLWRD